MIPFLLPLRSFSHLVHVFIPSYQVLLSHRKTPLSTVSTLSLSLYVLTSFFLVSSNSVTNHFITSNFPTPDQMSGVQLEEVQGLCEYDKRVIGFKVKIRELSQVLDLDEIKEGKIFLHGSYSHLTYPFLGPFR